jgi:DNA-binding CsgD family transcriptional regulator
MNTKEVAVWLPRQPEPEGGSLPLRRPAGDARLLFTVQGDLAVQLRRAARRQEQPPEALAEAMLARALEQDARRTQARARLAALTPREQEVASLAARGWTNRTIAAELVISPETVKTHIHHILEKLGVRAKAELRLRLFEAGLRPAASEWSPPADDEEEPR